MAAHLLQYLKEVQMEGKKVNWPTRKETLVNTFLVLLFSAAVAALLGAFDVALLELLNLFVF